MHSETLGFFSQRAVRVWTILKQFTFFLYALQLTISNCLEILTNIFSSSRVTSILISVFCKAGNEIIFPENKCILDGILDSGVIHRLRTFNAGLTR